MRRLFARLALCLAAFLVLTTPAAAQIDAPLAKPSDEPADTTGCPVETTPALEVTGTVHWGRTYVDLTVPRPSGSIDFYLESNQVAGLQRDLTRCEDGRVIEADTCVSRYGTTLTYCATQLPWTLTP